MLNVEHEKGMQGLWGETRKESKSRGKGEKRGPERSEIGRIRRKGGEVQWGKGGKIMLMAICQDCGTFWWNVIAVNNKAECAGIGCEGC